MCRNKNAVLFCNNSSDIVSLLEEHRYTAWGQRTSSTASPRLRRGFTGHEHLAQFGLIDMKARLYDPHLGQFLEPDPYVQAPEKPMSYNRYAYCLNNPLRYADPSGYIHAPAVARWPEGYDPPDHVDDPWGGSSGWARAMTPGMTYGWWAGLPAATYGPAYYAYFGSDGSRNAPPSSHFDHDKIGRASCRERV